MEKGNINRELVGVLFPGVVKNEERAIQCLGGIRNISQVHSNPTKKRLELSFQPHNLFVKKTTADTKKTSGLLLKVKIKKRTSGNETKREVVSTEVVGRVKKMFKFESMCDFQYLPVDKDANGEMKCLVEQIVPSGLDDASFLSKPAPSHIVPASFSRTERPTGYAYTGKTYHRRASEQDTDVYLRVRTERGRPSTTWAFNLIDDIPTEPNEFYMKAAESFPEQLAQVKKMFEETPIWSLNKIRYQTKIRNFVLSKVVLPCVSYLAKNGPWRLLWIKYGYDPRKEPDSRKYQLLDFRLRHFAGIHSIVSGNKRSSKSASTEETSSEDIDESVVYYRPGMIPSQKQTFFMICDISLPEVEAILSPDPPPGYLCHPTRGWLPHNAMAAVREAIFRCVKEVVLTNQNADIKFEDDASSDGGSNSDGNDYGSNSDDPEPSTSNT